MAIIISKYQGANKALFWTFKMTVFGLLLADFGLLLARKCTLKVKCSLLSLEISSQYLKIYAYFHNLCTICSVFDVQN